MLMMKTESCSAGPQSKFATRQNGRSWSNRKIRPRCSMSGRDWGLMRPATAPCTGRARQAGSWACAGQLLRPDLSLACAYPDMGWVLHIHFAC